jgi:hypothetical protein
MGCINFTTNCVLCTCSQRLVYTSIKYRKLRVSSRKKGAISSAWGRVNLHFWPDEEDKRNAGLVLLPPEYGSTDYWKSYRFNDPRRYQQANYDEDNLEMETLP